MPKKKQISKASFDKYYDQITQCLLAGVRFDDMPEKFDIPKYVIKAYLTSLSYEYMSEKSDDFCMRASFEIAANGIENRVKKELIVWVGGETYLLVYILNIEGGIVSDMDVVVFKRNDEYFDEIPPPFKKERLIECINWLL